MQRKIVCAANRCKDTGQVILGIRHYDFFMREQLSNAYGFISDETEQGFVDQKGVFLTRTEAWAVAEAAGQIARRVGGDDTNGGTLYSENLY
jgi:hypothetical protein